MFPRRTKFLEQLDAIRIKIERENDELRNSAAYLAESERVERARVESETREESPSDRP
jgi:hypothetical protein